MALDAQGTDTTSPNFPPIGAEGRRAVSDGQSRQASPVGENRRMTQLVDGRSCGDDVTQARGQGEMMASARMIALRTRTATIS
jgi:hypothetical protein